MKPILVIGGCNMDVLGSPEGSFRLRDSNIGRIRLRAGGVAHNIAREIALQGRPVELMTVLGQDVFAQALRTECEASGIGLKYALEAEGSSCAYIALHDGEGDMLAALNDMHLMAALDGGRIRALPRDDFSCCVLDANLSGEALHAAAEHIRVPLVADPVSCVKAPALLPILPRLSALKPNLLEAQALSGRESPEEAAETLLQTGLRSVFVSLGAEGLYYAEAGDRGYLRPMERLSAPATGAGDAMTAGIALAVAQGLSAGEAAGMGLALSHARLQHNLKELSKEGSLA